MVHSGHHELRPCLDECPDGSLSLFSGPRCVALHEPGHQNVRADGLLTPFSGPRCVALQ
jgi:hypothetical protein